MARFCFMSRRNLSLFAIFQLKFRRREVCLFFVATVSVSVLAGQRVGQASQAKLCRGQARPRNHNKRFPQYQATQAETFELTAASWAGGGSGKPGPWLAGVQNHSKRFLIVNVERVFSSEKVAFLKKYF
jgi:hypothetical protein